MESSPQREARINRGILSTPKPLWCLHGYLHRVSPWIKTSLVESFTFSFHRSGPVSSGLSDRLQTLLSAIPGFRWVLHVCKLRAGHLIPSNFYRLDTAILALLFLCNCMLNRYYTIFHFLPKSNSLVVCLGARQMGCLMFFI